MFLHAFQDLPYSLALEYLSSANTHPPGATAKNFLARSRWDLCVSPSHRAEEKGDNRGLYHRIYLPVRLREAFKQTPVRRRIFDGKFVFGPEIPLPFRAPSSLICPKGGRPSVGEVLRYFAEKYVV
ncbi:hypothetical protein BaRGS_00002893 [Batillaria attramentaria]|uniref:Uncharacterized protein n=1 Tax=Batillaria attramentaria TaxID=370345 RepID=A0ABD0M1N3_9CAEN